MNDPTLPPLPAGVRVKRLCPIPDERGRLMELYRASDDLFVGFAHSYLTTVYPGVVKAWHLHRAQTDTMAVVAGMLKLVIFDEREGSPTLGLVAELFLGEHNPLLVQIPPGLWHGFKGIGAREALVINFPDQPFHPDEPDEHRRPVDDPAVPYTWSLVHR